jgi:hypothetical protein
VKASMVVCRIVVLMIGLAFISPVARGVSEQDAEPRVTAVPKEVINQFNLDTTFYKKHLDYKGFSILSSAKVADVALSEARSLIAELLGERQDILLAVLFLLVLGVASAFIFWPPSSGKIALRIASEAARPRKQRA